jgi:hypothetical protein
MIKNIINSSKNVQSKKNLKLMKFKEKDYNINKK